MKDKEPKIHPLVRVGSTLTALALAASQVGCKVSPTTPEVTSTGTSPALTVEPPVGFEPSTPTPSGISTLPGAETPTPTESAVAAFRAPTLEELVVPMGEGGPLPEYAQGYYNVMDRAKVDIVQKVGVDPSQVKIRYWDNTGSRNDFGWMLYYQIEGGGVIWPLKPDGTLADYSTYFEGQVQPDGSIVNLRINSDYNNWVVAGDESTAAIFGGTLPVIVDFPKDANVNGETKLVYSRWIRPGGQPADYAKDFSEWQETSGILEPTPTKTPTPEAALPPDFTQEYLTRFENVHPDTRLVGDMKHNVLLGTNPTDGREQVIGMEMDGVMVRMGEYIDPEGHSIYAYIRPDYNLDGRIQVTAKTPEVLFEFFLKSISQGEFNGQSGGDIEKMRKIIWEQNGKLMFQVPTAPDATDPLYKDNFAVVWNKLPKNVDFNQPIEIIIMGSDSELESLNDQTFEQLIVGPRGYEFISGGLLWVTDRGGMQIFAIDSSLRSESDWGMNPQDAEQRKFALEYLRTRVGWLILDEIKIIKNFFRGSNAFLELAKYSGYDLDSLARSFLEYIVNPINTSSK